jgi:transposase-like protein
MKRAYQVVERKDSQALTEFLAGEGSALLPFVDLIRQAELGVDELIVSAGRSAIEAVLTLSARQVAGAKHPGKRLAPGESGRESSRRAADHLAEGEDRGEQVRGDGSQCEAGVRGVDEAIGWHGRQRGVVQLAERKLRVSKPRLRRKGKKGGCEVMIPAYEAMQGSSGVGDRLLEILMRGVSMRNYSAVLPEMAETVGIAKSSVSREFMEASEKALKELAERRFENQDILIMYLDGLILGGHHVVVALGVDPQGVKHVLGLAAGASENAIVVKGLLEDVAARGVKPGRRRLFVIDGSKALRSAIDAVYGTDNPVQRCRNHKIRNVLGYLPDHLRDQVSAAMKAGFRLEKGMAQLEKQAQWLDTQCPDAAGSLREGLAEMFTVTRLGLPATLRRCLCTTNVIESPQGTVRQKIGRVRRWRDGAMALRWVASAFLASEKSFRRLMGCQQLWMLQAYLDEPKSADANEQQVDQQHKVG